MSNTKFRFAHLADCHIGGWKEPELRTLSIQGFKEATKKIIEEKLDFLIIAGDLFNTSIPSIESLKQVASSMRKLKDHHIPTYIIAGSHDFSPSGKTMLDVLENAGLCTNVSIYNEETKELKITYHTLPTGDKIALTGMPGLAGGLERTKYEGLANRKELENLQGFKIFLFHTLLTELKPQSDEWGKVPSEPLSLLPKEFNYYPGGHPHFVSQKSTTDHPLIAYPGPLFPNNFKELEELRHGGFYIVEVNENNEIKLNHTPVKMKETLPFTINAEDKTPGEIEIIINEKLSQHNITDCIITLRIYGTLKVGKTSDIDFKRITESHSQAYIILKNTTKIRTNEFSEIKVESGSIEEVERDIIKEHVDQIEISDLQLNQNQELLTDQLMIILDKEKHEGEKNIDFETRIINEMKKTLNIGEILG
tara:strand:- start:4074 stop:5339 length:1266 start_codon:yes stop_codon:yes gene_type:complete